MISKAQIKRISSLRQAKFRDEEKVFVVEGVKIVQELLESQISIKTICATKDWIEENINKASKLSKEIIEVSQEELKKISSLTTPNQVLAVLNQIEEKEIKYKENYVLVLDEIKDPGNLGTIIRIADWFGIENIVCSEDTVDLYNPKTIQSTMGSFLRVNVSYKDIHLMLSNLQDFPIYGTIVEKGMNIYETNLEREGIIIIGSESHGISPQIRPLITHPITIPSFSKGQGPESLNASIATSIICSEFRRKR